MSRGDGVRGRVLVVDDDPSCLSSLSILLRRAGYSVEQADGGARAMMALDGHTFDAVLTDLWMPEMDGLELARRMHSKRPELPVIVMSAEGERPQADMRSQVYYLPKPLDIDLVMRVLDETIRGSTNP